MQAAVYNELEDKVRMVLLKMTNNFPAILLFQIDNQVFSLKIHPPPPSVSVSQMLKKVSQMLKKVIRED